MSSFVNIYKPHQPVSLFCSARRCASSTLVVTIVAKTATAGLPTSQTAMPSIISLSSELRIALSTRFHCLPPIYTLQTVGSSGGAGRPLGMVALPMRSAIQTIT